MRDDTIEAFGFPAIGRKKLTAAFDGGRITSDGGVLLLGAVERRLGIAEKLAGRECRDFRVLSGMMGRKEVRLGLTKRVAAGHLQKPSRHVKCMQIH